MAYSQEQIDLIFSEILDDIERGMSLRSSLSKDNRPASDTFYIWLESNEDKSKRYARAAEKRADAIFEEILEISNHTEEDHTPFTGSNVIQRDRLKIDARKWMLAKMNPKKYGDSIKTEHSGEITTNIISLGNGIKPVDNCN